MRARQGKQTPLPSPCVSLLVLLLWRALGTARCYGNAVGPVAISSSQSGDVLPQTSRNSLSADSNSYADTKLQNVRASSRVVIVNDIPGHFEVLAGVLHILHTLNIKPSVFYVGSPTIPLTWGLLEWLGETPSAGWEQLPHSSSSSTAEAAAQLDTKIATWYPVQMLKSVADMGLKADLVLCVSPELAPEVCRQVVEAARPGLLAVMLHRADSLSLNAKVLSLYDKRELFALAPHVAIMAAHKMRTPVTWTLPICPHVPVHNVCASLTCLHGFTIQGALRRYRNKNASGYTRNYMQLWQRLSQLKQQQQASQATGGDARPGVKVTVVGKGTRTFLAIPADLDADIQFYSRLPYLEFWARIHHSLALVPSLGHEEYYLSRITSTVVASLITGTPIIAEQRLLDVYQFLQPQHVFLRGPDEDEAAAMYRIAEMSEEDVMSRRTALVQLRQQLNSNATQLMAQWLEKAYGS